MLKGWGFVLRIWGMYRHARDGVQGLWFAYLWAWKWRCSERWSSRALKTWIKLVGEMKEEEVADLLTCGTWNKLWLMMLSKPKKLKMGQEVTRYFCRTAREWGSVGLKEGRGWKAECGGKNKYLFGIREMEFPSFPTKRLPFSTVCLDNWDGRGS